MTKAVLDIKRWGNSLGVRIPSAVAREAGIREHQRICIEVEAGRMIITPIETPRLTLAQRLAQFDPDRHAGEVMNPPALGAEQW
jgi:antitoxin MazE